MAPAMQIRETGRWDEGRGEEKGGGDAPLKRGRKDGNEDRKERCRGKKGGKGKVFFRAYEKESQCYVEEEIVLLEIRQIPPPSNSFARGERGEEGRREKKRVFLAPPWSAESSRKEEVGKLFSSPSFSLSRA